MAQIGRLTLDKMGYSMPVDAPAYQAPPYHYRNAQAISIKFETDLDSALDALPAPLELIEPATANLSFYWYPFTTFGPYHVAILRLYARHEGKRLTYIPCSPQEPKILGRNNTEVVCDRIAEFDPPCWDFVSQESQGSLRRTLRKSHSTCCV